MSVLNHAHKLKRHKYKTGNLIYFCVGDCTFRIQAELSLGKTVECWRCRKAFKMNSYSIQLAKPHCEECHRFKTEENKLKSANKNSQAKQQDQPLKQVAVLAGDNIVNNLEERLHSLTANLGELKFQTKQSTVEIKEFKLEDEEDLI